MELKVPTTNMEPAVHPAYRPVEKDESVEVD
jgi:hypothetical protein